MNSSKEINVVLIGKSGVGKSSLIKRIKSKKFKEHSLDRNTIYELTYKAYNEDIGVMFFDISGEDNFQNVNKTIYLPKADIVLLLFNKRYFQSIFELEIVFLDIRSTNKTAHIIIVETKCDENLTSHSNFSEINIKKFISNHSLTYIKTSSKENIGINDLENEIIQILNNKLMLNIRNCLNEFKRLKITSPNKKTETAIKKMTYIIEEALKSKKPKEYIEENYMEIQGILKILAKSSIIKSIENFITATIIIILSICNNKFAKEQLLKNELTKGNPLLFWTNGFKQKSEELLYLSKSINLPSQ